MRNVHYILIEDLILRQLGGWLFARNCSNVTIKNCRFERAMYGSKGGARFIECQHCRFINNTFRESSYDAMVLVMSDYNLFENNTFDTAGHAVLALRSASYNVIGKTVFGISTRNWWRSMTRNWIQGTREIHRIFPFRATTIRNTMCLRTTYLVIILTSKTGARNPARCSTPVRGASLGTTYSQIQYVQRPIPSIQTVLPVG